ncbi:hypothetical protein GCM10022270_17210 [Terriglobus aquaticus]
MAVGAVSSAKTVTLTLRSAGVALAPTATSEFTILPGGTCSAQQTYAAGDTCTLAVGFAPQAPGTVSGQVSLPGANGRTLATARLIGTGVGSSAAFTPGVVSTVAIASAGPHSFTALTTSASGVAYLADRSTGQILQVDPVSGTTSVVATGLPASDPVASLAADVDGTVYLLSASGSISRVDPGTTAVTAIAPLPTTAGASAPASAITVDAQGRLIAAFGTALERLDNGVWTALAANAACTDPTATCGDGQTLVHAQFGSVTALASDAAGDLYIVDAASSRIRRVDASTGILSTVAGTGTACAHTPCGDGAAANTAALGTLSGITVDALGDLTFAEAASGLRRIDASTGTTHSVLATSETRFRSGTVSPAALRDGSVLLLTSADASTVAEFSAASSTLTFAQTPVGQTSSDSVQTVTLTNRGNAPLTLATPAAGTNPSTTADFPLGDAQTCPQLSASSAAQSLAPGAACTLQVKFKPTTSGNISSRVVLTESASAAASTSSAAAPAAQITHAIAVQGAAGAAPGTAPASIALVSLPTGPVYGQPVSLNVSVYDATHTGPTPTGTLTFTEGSTTLGTATLSGGNGNYTVVHPSTGSHTYAVSYSGDSYYAASTQNTTIDVTVARAASVYTASLPTYEYGQDIRATYVLSGQYSGTGIALPSGVVTYTLFDSNGNVVVTGTSNSADRVNSIDENAPLGMLHGGTYKLQLSYPGDTNFLPLQQDLQVVVQPAPQIIVNFGQLPSPVNYGVPPIPLIGTAVSTVTNPATQTGLPVVFSVLSGPGTIVNNQLVVTGVGTIVVAANQPGNSDYAPAPQLTQTVISVRPVAKLVWNTPAPINVGTPLGKNQLNAVALDPNGQPLAGTYTYMPTAGTVLPVGPATLTVTFVPTDTDHYGNVTVTASVVLTVRDLTTSTITFAGGTTTYGTGLGSALNATATSNGAAIPGTFVYTTNGTTLSATSSLPVGTYTVLATFTPTDGNTYRAGSATATITVNPATVTVTFAGGSVTSGNALGATLNATATANGAAVPGTLVYTTGGTAITAGTVLPAGTYPVVASFTPSDATNYRGGSATATITVTRGTSSTTLTSSATPVLLNTAVTFTAHVTGGSPAPSGTVQFTSGSSVLGSAPVDATGSATFSLNTLPAGSQTITAVYSGDANYTGSSATVTEVVADFTLAVAANTSGTQSVLRGSVGTYHFTVSPTVAATLVGPVSFTLTGLPAGATYTLTPSTVASGSGATNVTLAVTVPALKSQVERSPLQRGSSVVAVALLLLPFTRRLRQGFLRTRAAGLLATVIFATAVLLSTTGCGAGIGYYDGSGQTTSTLTLTANSGSLSHAATVTLEVQ